MTYDKKMQKLPDKPQNIEALGYKDVFQYSVVWRGRKVQKRIAAVGYRPGTGSNPALSISTIDSGIHWDLIPINDHYQKWYFSTMPDRERQMKGFTLLLGDKHEEVEDLLLSNVEPRTCGSAGQGSREWFLDRMFSGTSSTVHRLLEKSVGVLIKTDENDDGLLDDITTVVKAIGSKELLDSLLSHNNNQDNNESMTNEQENPAPIDQNKVDAERWFEKQCDEATSDDRLLKSELSTMDAQIKSWLVALAWGSDYKYMTDAVSKKKIEKWLESPHSRRPYQMKNRFLLWTIANEKGIKLPKTTKKEDIIQAILNPPADNEQNGIMNASSGDDDDDDNEHYEMDELLPLIQLLDQSFLRPVRDKVERNAASIGLSNEEKFIRQFWDHCEQEKKAEKNNAFASFNLLSTYRPGLVKKKNHLFVKGSADGIFVAKVS